MWRDKMSQLTISLKSGVPFHCNGLREGRSSCPGTRTITFGMTLPQRFSPQRIPRS
ncbi:hypothetical protein CY34DRAFT_555348 [Suillus luteus UH-Slu-Lm8-n1]|uniref:Uncharacterized protein n=1 Tax=Suillus luteus UH-Slu-Lm8-n1 TaxID=930992 RepID=A0A0D0B5T5_9AGAM|nr:hypothetical protein CY34DRAFT_555348 [Suillus luteus UH-Slu-Lm8-n1]